MSKIAVTSKGANIDSPVDTRFGRADYFLIVDLTSGEFSAVENEKNRNAAQGAGIQAGKAVVGLGVPAVITGHVGPKAFTTLQAGGISIYTGAQGTVAETIELFKTGQLQRAATADVEGHWV
ncbi:MAG: NifB/NifX family molybdenum-iron cluster-binding protein [Phycisphaerales bacterium]|nr:NifB/NifX family molybdenum-iron cluster-binding protein [Phycisphaerales bacterium]